jgi:hypothetical protein
MKLLVLIAWLFPACFLLGQTPLPYVKDGKWSLVDTTGKLLTETDYSYIHTYDNAGFTFFCRNGAYGILDREGQVVVEPVYADVLQNGSSYYTLLSDEGWITLNVRKLNGRTAVSEWFHYLSASWAVIGQRDSLYAENLPTGKRWSLNDSTSAFNVAGDHFTYFINDSTRLLIDPAGNTVLSGDVIVDDQNNVYHARCGNQHYLFDELGAWPYRNISSVYFDEDGLFFRAGKEGVLCRYDRSVVVRGDYDIIGDFNPDYFYATRAGFTTLIDKQTKRPIVPFRYEQIEQRDSVSYIVYKDGFSGLVDLQFREIIPCRYSYFIQRGDLVQVFDGNYQGIYSLKRRTELIAPVYNSIIRTDNRFKAQRNELLTIIEIDDRHNIVKTAKIDNMLTIRQAQNSKRSRRIDPRLFTIGWYLDSNLVQPPGKPAFYSVKWGLRDASDSILIRPKSFPLDRTDLVYLPKAPYTLYYTSKESYMSAGEKVEVQPLTPVFLPKGAYYPDLSLLGYDSTDFKRRDFMRISSREGFGVLHGDGSLQRLSYIEDSPNTYLRYCEGKKIIPVTKNKEEMTEVPSMGFNNRFVPNPMVQGTPRELILGLEYPEGKWNYFGPDAKPLFSEPFAFAHAFLGKQAIVKTAKGWGVVSPDTVLIPGIYSHIERNIVANDTLFVVQLGQPGNRLLDTLGKVIPGPEIAASTPRNFIIVQGGQKFLCDTQFKPLSDGYSSMKFLKNGLILAKTKKEYTLFDPEGTMLFNGAEEPEAVYFNTAFVFKKGAELTLFDSRLNPVLENCSAVERHGDLLGVKKGGEWFVLNRDLELLVSEKPGQLFTDTISGKFAICSNGKTTVYDANGTRISRMNDFLPTDFIAGRLLVASRDCCMAYTPDGKAVAVFHGFQSLEVLENGALFVKIRRGNNLLFLRDWTPVLPEETRFRQLTVLGPDIYSFSTASGKTALYNRVTGHIDTSYRLAGSIFGGDLLLVRNSFGFIYVDKNFQPITKVTFLKALPFNGRYAAVADGRGWTLIDRDCRPLTYPNYGAITALNPGLFQTVKLPLQGVFDAKGKELIPVVYEQVRFLPNGLILCIKDGEFYYFRKNGTRLL